jgi:hypothetical protein
MTVMPKRSVFILIFLSFFFSANRAFAVSGYSYVRSITIQSSQISGGANLTQFPILVCGNASSGACNISIPGLNQSGGGAHVQNANGYDIIFTTDADCSNPLTWEMENYNASTGEFEAWVANTSTPLSYSSNTTFYMCYGNSAISSFQSTASSVWDSHYLAVYHLNGASPSFNDSTINAYNGVNNGVTANTGQIDGGGNFPNFADFNVPYTIDPSAAITISAWINPTTISGSKYVVTDTNNDFSLTLSASRANIFVTHNGSTNYGISTSNTLTAGSWSYLAATYDGSTEAIFLNGTESSQSLSIGTINSGSTDLNIGSNYGSFYVKSSLDEVRISNIARSPGWVTTEYNNQSAPSGFYSVGSESTLTIVAAAGGGNWSSTSTWVGGVVPTASNDVVLNASSGNVTIDGTSGSPSLARSLDCTGYTGTLTQASGKYLAIGDSVGGSLTLAAGMAYSANNASQINFVSTTTGNTITTAGKTMGNVDFNGVGGGWTLQDTYSSASQSFIQLDNGTLNTNAQTVTIGYFASANSNTRTLTITNSTITVETGTESPQWELYNATNMTLNASGSTIIDATGSFSGGGLTYGNVSITGGFSKQLSGANTFSNLTINALNKTTVVYIANNQIITGTLTLGGNSAINRLLIASGDVGTPVTITSNGTNTISNADFEDITGAGTASWNLSAITGGSGDCGGNSGITFTSSATQYWHSNSGSWSTASQWYLGSGGTGGAGRVPLPQDDVVFDANSFTTGSQTVSANMPRLGRNINWTGSTNTPRWNLVSPGTFGSWESFGSVTMIAAMTLATNTNDEYYLGGRGAYTFTSVPGQVFPAYVDISAPGGSVTLENSFNNDDGVDSFYIELDHGTFNANNFNVTTSSFYYFGGSGPATLNMGSGTWTLTEEGDGTWEILDGTGGLTFNANTSTIVMISDGSTTTFSGGGLTYYNLEIPTNVLDTYYVNGNNTFNTFNVQTAAQTVSFAAGSTQTISNFAVTGSSGNVITLNSQTSGSQFTLSAPSGIMSSDYLSIKDSNAAGLGSWYAGTHSTNVSNNTGWIFSAPPVTNALDISGD